MTAIGDLEFRPQRRVIALFRERLGYEYLGDWRDREGSRNIERGFLEPFLARQGQSPVLIAKVLREFEKAAALGGGRNLYEANRLLRYGARVKPEIELKRSTVSVGEGIRQSLSYQRRHFIRPFFTTVQLVMSGNDNS